MALRRAAAHPAGSEEELLGPRPVPLFVNPQGWLVAAAQPCLPDHVRESPHRQAAG